MGRLNVILARLCGLAMVVAAPAAWPSDVRCLIGTSSVIVFTLKPLKLFTPKGFTKSLASSAAVMTGRGGLRPGMGAPFPTRRFTVSKTAPRSIAKVSARCPAYTGRERRS